MGKGLTGLGTLLTAALLEVTVTAERRCYCEGRRRVLVRVEGRRVSTTRFVAR